MRPSVTSLGRTVRHSRNISNVQSPWNGFDMACVDRICGRELRDVHAFNAPSSPMMTVMSSRTATL